MQDTVNDYQDDGFEIKVQILNPEIRGTTKYVVYTVKGEDKLGSFEVTRRYSDFDGVRNVMLVRWPGCYVPAIPSKKMVGNMDAHFIEDRRIGLEHFLIYLAHIKHLWYSQQGQILLRSTAPELQKPLSLLSKPTPTDILSRYQSTFKCLSGKQINVSVISKINQFSQYLKHVIPTLRTFKQTSSNMINLRKKYNQQVYTLLQFMLPQYEKNCLKEYVKEENLIFYNTKDTTIVEVQNRLKEYGVKHQFDQLLQSFRKEKREVEAFLEAIKVKEEYENTKDKVKQKVRDLDIEKQKVMAGKSSITSKIKSKSKEDQLREIEIQIQLAQKEEAELSLICDISTVLLGYIEIDKFKNLRSLSYYRQLKRMATFQYEYAKHQNELWQTIINSEPIHRLQQ